MSRTETYKRKGEKSLTDQDDSHRVSSSKKHCAEQKKTENENGSLQLSVGAELAIELEKGKSVNENLNATKCSRINEKVGEINVAEERTFLLNNNVMEQANGVQSFEDAFSESSAETDEDYFDNEEHYQYQKKLLNKNEWPGIKQKFNAYKSYFVIKEFYRLVPYKMDPYVKFHALNMPDVKIHSVAFVGTVIFIRTRAKNKYFIFTVSDGTACIEVNYKRENLEKEALALEKINEKHRRFAKIALAKKPWLQDEFAHVVPRTAVVHQTIPPIQYDQEIPLKYKLKLQHDWWVETKGALFGKNIEIGDYLYIEGYCAFDFDRSSRPKDVTLNSLLSGKIIINGTYVKCITEDEYNSNLQTWLSDHVKSRYCTR